MPLVRLVDLDRNGADHISPCLDAACALGGDALVARSRAEVVALDA